MMHCCCKCDCGSGIAECERRPHVQVFHTTSQHVREIMIDQKPTVEEASCNCMHEKAGTRLPTTPLALRRSGTRTSRVCPSHCWPILYHQTETINTPIDVHNTLMIFCWRPINDMTYINAYKHTYMLSLLCQMAAQTQSHIHTQTIN